ncbi:MAG: hypothetical protein ABSD31_12645 [Candidatus Binataceae bacterium]|jgi:multisubunit Na+/H+ antiporter MnhC subunit
MLTNIVTYGALGAIGLYLFGSNDMHEMLFGLGMMVVAVLGYTIGDHLRRMAPIFGALETMIEKLDSKLDSIEQQLKNYERSTRF